MLIHGSRMPEGIATTLITAKINITTSVGTPKELINEIFAPWRSWSRSRDAQVDNGRDITADTEVFPPSGTNLTQFSEGSFDYELQVEVNEVVDVGDAKDVEIKEIIC